MEFIFTRKREIPKDVKEGHKFMICEKLIILLMTRKEVKFLCNRISLSLRACIIAELTLCDAIELNNGKVIGKHNKTNIPLLVEAMNKIYTKPFPPDELLYKFNGERKSGVFHIKNVRKKIYNSLEAKNVCKVENEFIFNKIEIKDHIVRIEVLDYIKRYLVESNVVDYEAEVLIVCLIFCSAINNVTICMTEKEAILAHTHIKKIKNKYMEKQAYDSRVELILFPVLKALLNS